ncbi:Uncharacterised protein [Burkholderia pseudomallei]|nr:Uncharacterised protein [Burkholderia pseudomallei]CAJ6959380.1 Uncharacterised protein [Burkholderia pseudomallei]CAJ8184936.1 Uncharacterised protein [Burkholderia pseudomallei]CAJ8238877.1 Uncharacterised protein [Burkholderia pseudomallei]
MSTGPPIQGKARIIARCLITSLCPTDRSKPQLRRARISQYETQLALTIFANRRPAARPA